MRVLLAALAASLVLAAPASAASPDIVVNQVYGGGGNSGATLTNDFVELYNRGTAPVAVDGWSIQYAAATGASWQVTPLTGSVAAGGHHLVGEAAGAGATLTPLRPSQRPIRRTTPTTWPWTRTCGSPSASPST